MTNSPSADWRAWTPDRCVTRTLDGPDGRCFDLLLSTPDGPAPAAGWPCLFVLDGGRFFGALAGAVAALSARSEKTRVTPMAVVGLAHREDAGALEDQRVCDFTRSPCPEGTRRTPGRADAFLRFLEQDVTNAAREAAPLDADRTSLFGHSLAGLFVLETLAARPDLFHRWIAVSPSLWWRMPDSASAGPQLLLGCGERETGRDMRARIEAWTSAAPTRPIFRLAPDADHGAAPFTLIPDALRHVSGG